MHVRPVVRTLSLGITTFQLTGCFALSLASRGAPEEAMREIVLPLEAVDLPVTHDHGHEMAQLPTPLWTTVPEKGWLHAFEYTLVDRDGNDVPSAVLHHFKVMRPDRRELTRPIMLHLVGSGSETTPVSLGPHVGYPLDAGDSLLVTAMLHNPTDRDFEGVRLTIRLQYSPDGPWRDPLPVVPFFAHVTPPMQVASYDLPPGVSERTVEITPAVSGRLLGLGGHLHKYGLSLRLEDAEADELMWQVESIRTEDGTVLEVPGERFVWQAGPRLEAGKSYRVTAVYDNPTGEVLVDEGMATLGGVFIPDDIDAWPEVDRSDPDYAWYLDIELNGMPMQHGPGG